MTDALFNANNPAAAQGPKGLNWPWQQQAPDGTPINIKEYIAKSTEGIDIAAQRRYIEPLALIYNDALPVVSLFERYSNDPIDTRTRVAGWLPLDDPIYQNNQGGDNYVAIQFLNGTLNVAPSGDKTFRTSFPSRTSSFRRCSGICRRRARMFPPSPRATSLPRFIKRRYFQIRLVRPRRRPW